MYYDPVWEIEDILLRTDENGEIIDKVILDSWERECAREELWQALENLKQAILDALRIPSIVSWLADKLEKIAGK
ncbi:MAG: hypothetical protein IJV91_10260 [Kiritimatiellae bacterium]|nr:hypothetical protein [Kiritimatiellia bacterium]